MSLGEQFEAILGAAQTGADWAWKAIYHEFAGKVHGYVAMRGAVDPANVVGEVFLQLARNVGSFSGTEDGFRSWVFIVAHHRLVDERRQRSRHPEVLSEPEDLDRPDQVVDVEESVLSAIGDDHVAELLRELTPDQRDVLLLRIVGQLTLEETAQATGRRLGAVTQLQRRALARLRRHLEAQGVTQ